jgi:hypothetical protein
MSTVEKLPNMSPSDPKMKRRKNIELSFEHIEGVEIDLLDLGYMFCANIG